MTRCWGRFRDQAGVARAVPFAVRVPAVSADAGVMMERLARGRDAFMTSAR